MGVCESQLELSCCAAGLRADQEGSDAREPTNYIYSSIDTA